VLGGGGGPWQWGLGRIASVEHMYICESRGGFAKCLSLENSDAKLLEGCSFLFCEKQIRELF
jgi:hypothetical protein